MHLSWGIRDVATRHSSYLVEIERKCTRYGSGNNNLTLKNEKIFLREEEKNREKIVKKMKKSLKDEPVAPESFIVLMKLN